MDTRTKPKRVWNEGLSFSNGKLYSFEARRVTVMSSWPDPRAWTRTPTTPWVHTRRHADEVFYWFGSQSRLEVLLNGSLDWMLHHQADRADRPLELQSRLVAFAEVVREAHKVSNFDYSDSKNWPESISSKTSFWPRLYLRNQLAMNAYCASIPTEVLRELAWLSERRWQVMNLFARVPQSIDLFRINPALAFCLANNWAFHSPSVTQPYRSARTLVRKKQRDIAEWLGFDGSDAVTRIMAKVEKSSLSVSFMRGLRRSLQNSDTLKALLHVSRINAPLLELICSKRLREIAAPSLLGELSDLNADQTQIGLNAVRRMWACLDMLERMQMSPPRRVKSIKKFDALHDQATRRSAEREFRPVVQMNPGSAPPACEFPPPPFEGSADIIPVRTMEELVYESQVMQHCVASYGQQVAAGKHFIYRLIQPVRATLAIHQLAGRWFLAEVSGFRNQPIEKSVAEQAYRGLVMSGGLIASMVSEGAE